MAERIDLRLGRALKTLDKLLAAGAAGTFDFAFIDADKPSYLDYYERTLTLLRRGGLVAVDNVLWAGAVADELDQSEDTRALRAFNAKLATDERVHLSLVPIGDGLTLAPKLLESILRGLRGAPALFVVLWSTGFVARSSACLTPNPFTFLTLRMAIVAVLLAIIGFALHAPGQSVAAQSGKSSLPVCWCMVAISAACTRRFIMGCRRDWWPLS